MLVTQVSRGASSPRFSWLLSITNQPVGGSKARVLHHPSKLAALSASKAGASSPAVKRNPSKTLEKKYLCDSLTLTHKLHDTTGGSVTSKNSGLLLPAVGLSFKRAAVWPAIPAKVTSTKQMGLYTRRDRREKNLFFFEIRARNLSPESHRLHDLVRG